MRKIYLVLSFVFLVSSCQKEELNDCGCYDLRSSNTEVTFPDTLMSRRFNYKNPRFNPYNNNEFVYYNDDWEYVKNGLYIHNIKENTDVFLAETNSNYSDWSIEDWILFRNGSICKIKSNGDSLTVLNVGGLFPTWSPDGEKIIYQSLENNGQLVIADESGIQLHFFDWNWSTVQPRWSPDGAKIATVSYKILRYIDLSTNKTITIDSIGNYTYGIDWFDDSRRILWSNSEGLYIIDTETLEKVKIRENCGSKQYWSPSFSVDASYFICERIDTRFYSLNLLYTENNIYYLSIDGLTEYKIDIPQ